MRCIAVLIMLIGLAGYVYGSERLLSETAAWWANSATDPSWTDGLVSYWSMRSSGTTVYDEFGTNDGTTINSPAFGTNYGVHNDGVLLNGTDQYIDCGVAATGYPFSVTAWINLEPSGSKIHTAVSFGNSNTAYYFAMGQERNRAWARWRDEVINDIIIEGTVPSSQWHLLTAVSAANDDHKLYRNGVLLRSTNFAITASMEFGAVRLGRILRLSTTTTFPYGGKLDEIGIWNRALTSNEVYEIYSTPRYYP